MLHLVSGHFYSWNWLEKLDFVFRWHTVYSLLCWDNSVIFKVAQNCSIYIYIYIQNVPRRSQQTLTNRPRCFELISICLLSTVGEDGICRNFLQAIRSYLKHTHTVREMKILIIPWLKLLSVSKHKPRSCRRSLSSTTNASLVYLRLPKATCLQAEQQREENRGSSLWLILTPEMTQGDSSRSLKQLRFPWLMLL